MSAWTQRDCEWFNTLLTDNAELALGPDWRADLDRLDETGAVTWEGVQGGMPSTNDLPTALKKGLAVFFHIRAFDGGPSNWSLDAGGLADALAVDDLAPFGFEGSAPTRLSDDEAFTRALSECTDADGFLIVSKLADRFGEFLGCRQKTDPRYSTAMRVRRCTTRPARSRPSSRAASHGARHVR